jgi:hypothetical protein
MTDDVDHAMLAHYFSTYCLHADHLNCRLTCKICDAPCRCPCHAEVPASDERGDFERRERAAATTERRARQR